MRKQTDKKQETRYSFLFRLTTRFTLFLTGSLVMAMVLYAAGNFQRFLDGTQQVLLVIASVTSLALMIFSAAGIIECVLFGIAWRHKAYWLRIILFAVAEVLGIAAFILCRLVVMLSEGVRL